MEKGESTRNNYFLVIISYLSYSQLWLFVSIYGIIKYFAGILKGKNSSWYKTERTAGVENEK